MLRGGVTESVGRTLGLNSSAAGRPYHVRFCGQLNWPVCPVSRQAVMVRLLTTIRAGERLVVTASKCGIYCFNYYLIPSRNCAVIMRRHFVWLHGDRRGGIFGRPLFDTVNTAVINYYDFTAQL